MNELTRQAIRKLDKEHAEAIEAALHNEEVTRQRVDALETWAHAVGSVMVRDFFGRLRWLVMGK